MLRLQQFCLLLLGLLQVGHGAYTNAKLRRVAEEDMSEAPDAPSEIARIRGGFTIESPFSWLGVFDDTLVCGVTLVHTDIVVTTASCLRDGFPTAVRIGSLTRGSGGTVVQIKRGIVHPDWTGDASLGNDIAVLQLESFLTNTVAILNDDPTVPSQGDESLFMAGYGLINDSDFAASLQGLFLNNVENCFDRAPPVYNPVFHFCGDANATAGTCPGDSGTPIVLPGTRLVVGLNSFSDRPCETQTIDIYSRMSTYSVFVKKMICDMSEQAPASCTDYAEDICLFESVFDFLTNLFGI